VIESIVCPNVDKIGAQPRVIRWTGVSIASGTRLVEAIEDGSPAMRSGLAIGDEVEVVNGQPTGRFIDVLRAFYAVEIGEPLALTIRRGESTLEFVVPVERAPLPARVAPSRPLFE
jgi:S1-C subfamily serine protease